MTSGILGSLGHPEHLAVTLSSSPKAREFLPFQGTFLLLPCVFFFSEYDINLEVLYLIISKRITVLFRGRFCFVLFSHQFDTNCGHLGKGPSIEKMLQSDWPVGECGTFS